eukprot:Gregarina_sp_Pseudo_9__3876@NODE_401_length_2918_cov_49_525877_g378_i0_p1_GENE_NODE_401_length_2918_cov_49_525877_g378_i0NODE_401_length_2918_cov_49_525877_g378_i0_p1_ORF_typecomplete_len723_score94_36ZZ/PF00569_17/1_4e03ZZ/PF00569_17/1e04ZZ/PF00569_17/2_4e07Siva/PF05458_12/0_3Siva/PF05458_12/75_NODE_401_length_2918_cov_49_525877_g378_i06342802
MKNWVFHINAEPRSLSQLRPESQLFSEYVFGSPLHFDDLQAMLGHAAAAFGHDLDPSLPRGVLCVSGAHHVPALSQLTRETFPIICTILGGVSSVLDSDHYPTAFEVGPSAEVIVVPMVLMMETPTHTPQEEENDDPPREQHDPKTAATLVFPPHTHTPTTTNLHNDDTTRSSHNDTQPCQTPGCSQAEAFGVFPCGHALCAHCERTICSALLPACSACGCPVVYVRPIEANHELGSPQSIETFSPPEPPPPKPEHFGADSIPLLLSNWADWNSGEPLGGGDRLWLSREGVEQRCFEARGPRPLLQVLAVLEASNVLTANMLAALLLQFMPTIFQRVQKKVGRINKGSSSFIVSWFSPNSSPETLVALRQCINIMEQDSDLARYATQLKGALSGRPGAPKIGTLLVDCLRTFSDFSFSVQAFILTSLAPDLLPIWRKVLSWCSTTGADEVDHGKVTLDDITHWGYHCAACGMRNVYGPRFRCDSCHTRVYDLCGPCYLTKYEVHDSSHVFRCLFRDVRHSQPPTDTSSPIHDPLQRCSESNCGGPTISPSNNNCPSFAAAADEYMLSSQRLQVPHNLLDGIFGSIVNEPPPLQHTRATDKPYTRTTTKDAHLMLPSTPHQPVTVLNHLNLEAREQQQEDEDLSSFSRALTDFLSRNVVTLKDLLSAPLTEEESLRAQHIIASSRNTEFAPKSSFSVSSKKKRTDGGAAAPSLAESLSTGSVI